jgi:hypothetical protein
MATSLSIGRTIFKWSTSRRCSPTAVLTAGISVVADVSWGMFVQERRCLRRLVLGNGALREM